MAFVLKGSEHPNEQEYKQTGPVEQDSVGKNSETHQAIDFEVREASPQSCLRHIVKVAGLGVLFDDSVYRNWKRTTG
jgi:hypothetical protein